MTLVAAVIRRRPGRCSVCARSDGRGCSSGRAFLVDTAAGRTVRCSLRSQFVFSVVHLACSVTVVLLQPIAIAVLERTPRCCSLVFGLLAGSEPSRRFTPMWQGSRQPLDRPPSPPPQLLFPSIGAREQRRCLLNFCAARRI